MNRPLRRGALLVALALLLTGTCAMSQTVLPDLDPNEKPGERPYEMVWANRREPAPPTLRFDALRGWTMQVEGGAEAVLRATRTQDVWNRPVARLRYRADGKPGTPRVRIAPPQPVTVPEGADCVEMWVYGNRWDWVNPPGTPPVQVVLRMRDVSGQAVEVLVDSIRWEEWWLMHRKLPTGLRFPAVLESLEFRGGWQAEWREIFLDSLRFYKESLAPLQVASRPQRNLTLYPGQSPGANTGPGRLPFPTREETILPMHMSGPYRNATAADAGGIRFSYEGKDSRVEYRFRPEKGLSGLLALYNDAPVGAPLDGAGVRLADGAAGGKLLDVKTQRGVVTARYDDGTTLRLQIKQKSLLIDVTNAAGRAADLAFGQVTGVKEPRTVWMPYMTYGGSHPSFLVSKAGRATVFTSLFPDWYRSNGSELYGAEQTGRDTARINGGVRYRPRTDGKRNPMYERLFLTLSPMLEEVLPVVPNPVGLHAKQAADRLWQESWGPDDYEKQMKRSRMLRAHGIEKLIQCNHEIAWRDGGESFTLRLRAAPKKGGDEALQKYVAHQKGLDWLSGLYTNYTDFSPVNEHWTPDAVQRDPNGEWRSAWPRCWAEKPLAAVQFDALLAPQIQAKYGSNSAYTDVHTAVAPWGYCDYDARLPGAGTFAQTFYAYGELLRNDSRVYGGPIFSEGTYQWVYAGLADGNYALAYGATPLAQMPLLPVFDLYQIHTKECDIGMGWTSNFCDGIPDWHAPQNIDRAIDRFLLNTLAYGHIGWLVEEDHGIGRTCRSYYMLQQVQARYGLKTPRRIAYWDGRTLRSVSEAVALDLPRTRRQLYVEYPGGLALWLNDHPSEAWRVRVGGQEIVLPPAGWAAEEREESRKAQGARRKGITSRLLTFSALRGAGKVDYLRSDAYVYLDGRGRWFDAPEAASDGALAITKVGPNRLRVLRIGGEGDFVIRRPYGVKGALTQCRAFDVEGKPLVAPQARDSGAETWVTPVKDALRYELAFSGRTAWTAAPERAEAAPGSAVRLVAKGAPGVVWRTDGGTVEGGTLRVPADAPVGSWIRLRAERSGEARETQVRVVAPVEWAWQADARPEETTLTLRPAWKLVGLPGKTYTVALDAPEGWAVEPRRLEVDAAKPLRSLTVRLTSTAPAGTEGSLVVRLENEPGAPAALRLRRVEQPPTVADLSGVTTAWGIARRGGKETPNAENSGAVFSPDSSMAVGGVVRRGLFMHPPYTGGVGYTWAETAPLTLPAAPCRIHAFIGLRDGGDPSDGVLYRVEVMDAKGAVHRVAEGTGVQREWRELAGDLSAFAGQQVRLRLIADVGPADNSAADWACWGEPLLQLAAPQVVTEVR